MLANMKLLARPKIKATSSIISLSLSTLNQQRHLSNWTHRPTKDFEKENIIGKASHARRQKEKKFYKWTVNPSVTRKEIQEHNAKVNAPGTKKEQVVSTRNKEYIQQIYAAAKQQDPKAAIEAYHRCSHGLDVRTYSAIIKSMEKDANHIGDAFQVYNDMKKGGKKGNLATYTHLLNVCINANHLTRALYVMKEMMIYANIGKSGVSQATSFFKKLIRLCYVNNEPGRAVAVYDCMRNAKVGELKPEELQVTNEIPFEYIRRVISEEIKIPKESEELQEFWIAMNKAKRPSFTTQASPMLPSSSNKSFGLFGKSEQRAIFEAELRKLNRLTQVDEDVSRENKALDFDEYGLSTRDHLELRSITLNTPMLANEQADVDQSLKQSYKTAALEFSHAFYSTLFNDNNYTPVDAYSTHTETLAEQYSALLKNNGLSEKEIKLEVDSFKAFAEAHYDVMEQHLSEDGSITFSNEYMNDLINAMETNWTPAYKHDHQIMSMIPTVAGASANDSAILLSQPMKTLMDKFVEAESLQELDPVLDGYKSEMNKITRYVNRKVDWQPVVLGVDGRPFFPSEDVISIDEVTTETIERAKQAYIDSIKDEEVKKQIKEEFYDYIHLVWIDGKGRLVEGISY